MNTCSPAIATINPLSIKLNLKILPSVLRTVLKFRFSRVRKYFCCLTSVDTWPDSLRIVSSTPESCSGDAPAFCGREERTSFSTCVVRILAHDLFARAKGVCETAYSDLKIHKLIRNRRHSIIEAEPILPNITRCEDEITLFLLLALEYHAFFTRFLAWSIYRVVDCIRISM